MNKNHKIEELINGLRKKLEGKIVDYIAKETAGYTESCKNILSYDSETVERLNLSHRSYRILKEEGVETIGDLICMTEKDLYNIRKGFGKKSLTEIIYCLNDLGLKLRDHWND